jgi:hypothetical protein
LPWQNSGAKTSREQLRPAAIDAGQAPKRFAHAAVKQMSSFSNLYGVGLCMAWDIDKLKACIVRVYTLLREQRFALATFSTGSERTS